MNKRSLLIFLALFLPVFIFLFLKIAGSNRFDVDVFHSTPSDVKGCNHDIEFPYFLKSSSHFEIGNDSLTLVILEPGTKVDDEVGLLVICEKIAGKPVRNKILSGYSLEFNDCNAVSVVDDVNDIGNCELLIPEYRNMVLIDGLGRIRGYYQFPDRDELDRLAVEIEILIQNGENRSVSRETN